MHDHDAEVVREGVRNVVPLAGEVLEPDLRLLVGTLEQKSNAAVLRLRIDLKGNNVLLFDVGFFVARISFIRSADAPKLESFAFDLFDVAQFV